MVVGEAGKVLGSVTIGGCVDAQVIEEAEDVLTSMRPRLLEMNLGDEEAWEIGLTCGGTIEVFVEPLALDQTDDTAARFYDRVRAHAERGGIGAVVTRLDGNGGKLLVLDDGTVEGSLGESAVTDRFVAEAHTAIAQSGSRTVLLEDVRALRRGHCPARVAAGGRRQPRGHAAHDPGPDARLPHCGDRWPAALCHARALPRRGRSQDRHSLGADHRLPARSLDRAGSGRPRLQVRPAGAAARPGQGRGVHRHARLVPAGGGHPEAPARGGRGRSLAQPRAGADRPRPGRQAAPRRSRWRCWPRSRPCGGAGPASR